MTEGASRLWRRRHATRSLASPPQRNLGVRGLPCGVLLRFTKSFPPHSGQSSTPLIQLDGHATGRPPLFTLASVMFASSTLFARHQRGDSTTGSTLCAHVSVCPSCV